MGRAYRLLTLLGASVASLGAEAYQGELVAQGQIEVVTPTPIVGRTAPQLIFRCGASDESIDLLLFDSFGKNIMELRGSRISQVSEGECKTPPLGRLIEPPLSQHPCGGTTICIKPPRHEGLWDGAYRTTITVRSDKGTTSSDGNFDFDIAPFDFVDFAQSVGDWSQLRGNWSLGVFGISVKGNGGEKPQYFWNKKKNIGYTFYRSNETVFMLGCFSNDCEAGHTVALMETDSSGGVVRYAGLQAGITGDLKLSVKLAHETVNGMEYYNVLGPVDVREMVEGENEIRLRTEAVAGFIDYVRVAVYINDKLVQCAGARMQVGDGYPSIYFRGTSAGDGAEFKSHRMSEGRRHTSVCSYIIGSP